MFIGFLSFRLKNRGGKNYTEKRFRYSLGEQPFFCLNILLKVEILENPDNRAASVTDRPDWRRSSSAAFSLL